MDMKDYEKMTTHELKLEKIANAEAVASVKKQLLDARIKASTTGEYSDPKWYSSAVAAQSAMGINDQKINMLLGERKAEDEQHSGEDALAVSFLAVCVDEMHEDFFAEVMEEAKERLSKGGW